MTSPWVVTSFNHYLTVDWYIVIMETNVAFTGKLQVSLYPPRKYRIFKINRGVRIACGFNWRLWRTTEYPDEGRGPQTVHKFYVPKYPPGTYLWYRMKQTYPTPTAGKVTPIFMVMIPACPVISTSVTIETADPPPDPPADDQPVTTIEVTYEIV
jgi:hypothetical protein